MTTIAYRDGVMAADSGVWHGDAMHTWAKKLARGNDGVLYGATGNAAPCNTYLEWVESGYEGEEPKAKEIDDGNSSSFSILIAKPGEPLRLRTAFGDEVYDVPYLAIGGGAQCAYGAMYAGASAELAIKAAIEHGSSAVGKAQIIEFEPAVFEPITGKQAQAMAKRAFDETRHLRTRRAS